jgi:hypothetical protein
MEVFDERKKINLANLSGNEWFMPQHSKPAFDVLIQMPCEQAPFCLSGSDGPRHIPSKRSYKSNYTENRSALAG